MQSDNGFDNMLKFCGGLVLAMVVVISVAMYKDNQRTKATIAAAQFLPADRNEWPRRLSQLDKPWVAVEQRGDGYVVGAAADNIHKTTNCLNKPCLTIWVFHRNIEGEKWIIGRYDMVQPKPESP